MKEKSIKGITLVALVITIVILLILAGISIQAITNTGLFANAKRASEESKYANAEEKVKMAVMASYDENASLNKDLLKKSLNKIDGINPKVTEVTWDLKVNVDGYEFTITEYGTVTCVGRKEQEKLPENNKDNPQDAGMELTDEDVRLATLIGLLHDIGRFEQLKRFDSFIDSQTVDHAKLGIEVLTDNNNELLRKFCPDEKYHEIILTAIGNHNKFKIDNSITEIRMLTHCKIIRDADKLDILNLLRFESFETLFKKTEIIQEPISKQTLKDFLDGKEIIRSIMKTDMDDWVGNIGYVYDIYYPISYKILKEKNYINDIIDRTPTEEMEKIREKINTYINEKAR